MSCEFLCKVLTYMKVQLQVHGQVISAGVGLDPVGQRAGFMPAVKIYLLTSKPQINFFLPTLVIFKIFILMPRNRCCFPFPSPLSTFILSTLVLPWVVDPVAGHVPTAFATAKGKTVLSWLLPCHLWVGWWPRKCQRTLAKEVRRKV